MRYLHFGTEWIQGGMRIARPYQLELEYQQQMMALLLLLPRPQRILQLGLGAAALTKFCHRHLPGAETMVVELEPAVIETARRWFRLPAEDERLTVVEGDALEFLRSSPARAWADWLQVDLYDAEARGPVYDDESFYRSCRAVLRHPGVAAFNLFGRSAQPSLARLRAAFDERVLCLPEADAGNCIALALAGPCLDLGFAALFARARRIEDQHRLPARRWVSGLRAAISAAGAPLPERLQF